MNVLFRIACACLLLLPFTRVEADSFYWDPLFNGEGWSIDRQNDLVFLAYYTYETNNQPTFLTAVGAPVYSVVRGPDADEDVHIAQFTATLFRSQRGQNASAAGTLSFRHEQGNGIDRILVSFNNQSRTLVPFYYSYTTPGDALFGLWALSFIDGDFGVAGSMALFEADSVLALSDGGLVLGMDPANDREVLGAYLLGGQGIVMILETSDPDIDRVVGVFHGVKDSRPMRGIWVLVDENDQELTPLLPFTATKYRSLGELDDVGVYAAKSAERPVNTAFRERALARLGNGGAEALIQRLRARR